MKKLLFVPSLALVGIIAGCTTQLVDSQGNPVCDSNGNVVMVSSSTKEKVEKSAVTVRESVRAELETASKSGRYDAVATSSLSDEKISALAGADASPEDVAALKAVAEAEAAKYRIEVLYPARVTATKKSMSVTVAKYLSQSQYKAAHDYLVKYRKTGIEEIDGPVLAYIAELNRTKIAPAIAESVIARFGPVAAKKTADGKYEEGREVLWRMPVSVSYNAEAAAKVRDYAVEQMRTVLNPAEWAAVKADVEAKVKKFAAEKKFDEAIAWLKAYRRVRTHSAKLDEKLGTIEAELVKVGVKKDNMAPILSATEALVSEAARIADMTDVTTNTVTTTEGREIAGISPDLEAYNKRLEEYRKMLVRFDCTEDAARSIVEKFKSDVGPLLAPLSRPASKEKGSSKTKSFLQLGTGALNVRIDKLIAAAVADMEEKKAAHLAALREAAVKAAVDGLAARVRELVANGEFAQAREEIWKATSTEDLDMNARVRSTGVELMLTLVNPAHWAAIEQEFADKAKDAAESAAYDDAIAWVEEYPDIRTYTAVIDEKLDVVKDELAKIGVADDKVQPVIDETRKATIEAERLASHVDTVKDTVTEGPNKPKLDEYEKLLADYRTALVRNDCTDGNADKLVADFKAKIAPYIALLSGGTAKSELLLGSNAVNDRLAKLRAKTLEELKSKKYRYVFSDLIAKVSEAVAEGRYSDARDAVRDVPLVQDAEWDARICATRIGLLNSVVNPNQCAALLKEIDEKAKELFDARRYEEFREYAENYEYVHDTYEQIVAALAHVKAAMVGLTIAEKDAGEYIDRLSARIREMLEKRVGSYKAETDLDLSELEKALAELEKGIVAQYYRPEDVKKFCETVKNEIISLITKTPDPMTTWELNEALAARLAKHLSQVDGLIAERDEANAAEKYAKLLAEIDEEVSFDSQVAMAEDAIAKQLGVRCPEACLKLNALLGEYARTMRLLKLGKKIDASQATVALLGGVYLDQPAVVARALELGADANGVSDRDPLGRTGVLLAIQTGHNSFLKQLADAKAALDPVDANGDTALHYAVRRGNLSVVKAMLAKNGVDKANKSGETALFIAVRRNQASVAAALVAAKADVSVKNAKGMTAMDAACLAGSRDVLDVLADAGAEFGPAQLALAAAKDRLAVAQWLVGKGVDVNAPGVMDATTCRTATRCYLVHEGGVLKPCDCECCNGRSPDKCDNCCGKQADGAACCCGRKTKAE